MGWQKFFTQIANPEKQIEFGTGAHDPQNQVSPCTHLIGRIPRNDHNGQANEQNGQLVPHHCFEGSYKTGPTRGAF